MNPRIRELFLEADFPKVDIEREAERFAELIVRHCTYQCYLIGESGLAHELSDEFGFKFDFRKMMEEDE